MVDSVFTAGYEKVVAAVVDMRRAAGFTQRELAEKLGREQSFVGRVETGQRRLDLVELVWIAKVCGVDPREVTGRLVQQIAQAVPVRKRKR